MKTSLAPGSKVVTDYYRASGLLPYLDALGFNLVGYGCTTCIGNSGPLPDEIADEIHRENLVACAVLSGNRNFEGRINSDVRANYLMSPPLVVAFALAGRIDVDLSNEPLGTGSDGRPVYLQEIWPTPGRDRGSPQSLRPVGDVPRRATRAVYEGDEAWRALAVPEGDRFAWDPESTYVRRPPYFDGMERQPPERVDDISGLRVIADPRRQRHHRPHLAGGQHQEGLAGGAVPRSSKG